jgi:cell division protein FtsZ
MAIGHGVGDNRCIDAAKQAIESPLLEMNIQGATGVLYNITGGATLTLIETKEAADIIGAAVDEDAEIIYGTSIDDSLGDAVMITLIATGFDDRRPGEETAIRRSRGQLREPAHYRSTPPPPPPTPRRPGNTPLFPEDDWETESSIIRFLRER